MRKTMKKRLIYTFCLFVLITNSYAQDVQISQYYSSPLFLNPAMVGLGDDTRVGFNYRNQWAKVGKAFSSQIAFGDHHFSDYNASVGTIVMNQQEGHGKLRTTEMSLLGGYTINVSKEFNINAGLQATYGTRGINYDLLDFGDQYTDADGLVNPISLEGLTGRNNRSYFDFSTGALLYGGNMFLGVSVHHLRKHDFSLDAIPTKLDRKLSVQGGYKVSLEKAPTRKSYQQTYQPEKSLIFVTNYKQQGNFNQFDIGAYLIYEPMMFGLWYRGFPIGGKEEPSESVVFMVGAKVQDFKVGYSYDYALNNLRGYGITVHEISLIYEFPLVYKSKLAIKKGPKEKRKLPCSKFLL